MSLTGDDEVAGVTKTCGVDTALVASLVREHCPVDSEGEAAGDAVLGGVEGDALRGDGGPCAVWVLLLEGHGEDAAGASSRAGHHGVVTIQDGLVDERVSI